MRVLFTDLNRRKINYHTLANIEASLIITIRQYYIRRKNTQDTVHMKIKYNFFENIYVDLSMACKWDFVASVILRDFWIHKKFPPNIRQNLATTVCGRALRKRKLSEIYRILNIWLLNYINIVFTQFRS